MQVQKGNLMCKKIAIVRGTRMPGQSETRMQRVDLTH